MKKLMIAACAVAFAAAAQAAQFSWGNACSVNVYDDPDVGEEYGDPVVSGTMYLINAATISRQSFANQVLAAGKNYSTTFQTLVATAFASATITDFEGATGFSAASPEGASIDPNTGAAIWTDATASESSYTFYQVLLDTTKNGLYISDEIVQATQGSGYTDFSFDNTGSYSRNAFGTDVTTWQSEAEYPDGWYTVKTGTGPEPTPEPTSAMLMLLGVAGLALRRKQK